MIDSVASKHMTGFNESFSCLEQKESPHKVMLGKSMKMKDVLYVPGLKKNNLSISALDKKGFIVSFVDGNVLMWKKGKTIDDAIEIGVEEGGIYKLKGHTDSTLTTSTIKPCELWNIRISRVHYKSLPIVSKVVIGLPEIQIEHEGVCKGCGLIQTT